MDEMILKYAIEGGAVTILGGLCFYPVVHFNRAIAKSTEVIDGNTRALEKLSDATNKQLIQLESIVGTAKRLEEKLDRFRDEFIEFKSKREAN